VRIGIVSDIHGNLEAFRAVLDAIQPFDQLWCLGDVVGYGPDPAECLELLREHRHLCVLGNHDAAVVGQLDLHWFNVTARRAIEWTASQLGPSAIAYLKSLPEKIEQDKFTLVHGSLRQPLEEYLVSADAAMEHFRLQNTPYCLIGHSHIPLLFRELVPGRSVSLRQISGNASIALGRERTILNPGSVGQPRDGNPWASCAVLDIERALVEVMRVPYDIPKVQRKIRAAGLPGSLADRLSYGT
jgi:predicted phosphodiesterase